MENSFPSPQQLDDEDDLRSFRDKFYFPSTHDQVTYLNGNSLGLQPKMVESYVKKELDDWKHYGVEGHFEGDTPWLSYHELLSPTLTHLLGANLHEVVMMNTLTVNLHLMMVSFYRPTDHRYKILVEYSPFPSDMYAVKSQLRYHGIDEDQGLIELQPDKGEIVSNSHIKKVIEDNHEELALIMLGGVNYYTGQTYDMEYITSLGNQYGIIVGFDLAHAVGNVNLDLHDWGVDFAVFCSYKYLNSGPGSVGGCYVHERHADVSLPRFEGWWGHDKKTRFEMDDTFVPIYGAEGWQLSNSTVLSMAAIRASFDLFDEAGMERLIAKRKKLVAYARYRLRDVSKEVSILTPDDELSGSQLSLVIHSNPKHIHTQLNNQGVICDWREPNVIRVALVPMYNSFTDIDRFVSILADLLSN